MTAASQSARSGSKQAQILEGPVTSPLVRLAIPNTASNVLMIIPSLVEAWRIAELGGTALAGVALVFPLFILLAMWSAGSVGGAISGAIARAVGAGDIARAESLTRSALVIGLGGGLIMTVLVLVGGRWLFSALGGNGPILENAWAYASVLFAFNVVIWLFNIAIGVMRGAGDMIRPLIALAVICGLHFFASGPVILGFGGWGGWGGWGVSGAAALLVATYGVGLILALVFLSRSASPVRLCRGAVDWSLTGQLLKTGLFAASQSLITIITSLILTGFAARFGPDVLAGYGIGARIELLMIPMIFGVGGAAIALAGAATGAGLHQRAVRVGWTTTAIAAAVVGGIGILLALFAEFWAPAFSANTAITSALVSYMERVGPFYAFFAIGLALFFTCQGMGTLLYPVLGTVVRLAVALAGGFLIFSGSSPGANDLFIVVAAAMASYGIFVSVALWRGPWRTTQ